MIVGPWIWMPVPDRDDKGTKGWHERQAAGLVASLPIYQREERAHHERLALVCAELTRRVPRWNWAVHDKGRTALMAQASSLQGSAARVLELVSWGDPLSLAESIIGGLRDQEELASRLMKTEAAALRVLLTPKGVEELRAAIAPARWAAQCVGREGDAVRRLCDLVEMVTKGGE